MRTRFLMAVLMVLGALSTGAGAAESTLVIQAVDATAPGAQLAGLQAREGLAGAILQNLKRHEVVAGHENPIHKILILFCDEVLPYELEGVLCAAQRRSVLPAH